MPIQPTIELQDLTDNEFAEIDAIVMRCAYATQNFFGHWFDEMVYENDLARRLRSEGMTVHTQVPLRLNYKGFEKLFYFDLVVNNMLYELKAVTNLAGDHSMQALNYAMLQGLRLVKLNNFGEPRLHGRLLRNALWDKDRFQLDLSLDNWNPLGSRCELLHEEAISLVRDWGTHLSCRLYNEALMFEFGGEAACLQRIDLLSNDGHLGSHIAQLYDDNRAFVFTGFNKAQDVYRQHLRVFLEHAPTLKSIQWLNLNNSCLEMTTIERR